MADTENQNPENPENLDPEAEQAPVEQSPDDVYDPRKDDAELTTPDDPKAAAYANTLKAVMYPDRYDPESIPEVEGVDFKGAEPEEVVGDPLFLSGN
jgi:hypothetical protein